MNLLLNKYIKFVKKTPLFKDSLWSLIGNVIAKGLSLLAGIYIARSLGKDIYGEYGMIKFTLVDIALFSTFGLGFTATRFIAHYINTDKSKVKIIIGLVNRITLITSGTMSLLLFLFSKQVALFLEAEHLFFTLKIFSIIIIFNAFTTSQIGVLAGFSDFKTITKNNTISGIVTFIFSIILTYLWKLEGALIALLISNIVNYILNLISVRKKINDNENPRYKEDKSGVSKEIIIFSLPIALQEGLSALSSWLKIFILIKLTTYGDVGLFSAANQWSSIILFVPGILSNVTLSHLSKTINDLKNHNNIFKTMLLVNFVSTFIPFIIVFIFSNYIPSLYGETFSSLSIILNISVFTTIFLALSNVYTIQFMSLNMNWIVFFIKFCRDIGIIGLTVFFLSNNNSNKPGAYFLVLSSLMINILFLTSLHLLHVKTSKTRLLC